MENKRIMNSQIFNWIKVYERLKSREERLELINNIVTGRDKTEYVEFSHEHSLQVIIQSVKEYNEDLLDKLDKDFAIWFTGITMYINNENQQNIINFFIYALKAVNFYYVPRTTKLLFSMETKFYEWFESMTYDNYKLASYHFESMKSMNKKIMNMFGPKAN